MVQIPKGQSWVPAFYFESIIGPKSVYQGRSWLKFWNVMGSKHKLRVTKKLYSTILTEKLPWQWWNTYRLEPKNELSIKSFTADHTFWSHYWSTSKPSEPFANGTTNTRTSFILPSWIIDSGKQFIYNENKEKTH